MRAIPVLVAVLLMAANAEAVTVTLRLTVPGSTPVDATIHVAGDFQGWDPAAPAYALLPDAEQPGVHEISLDFEPGTQIQFKFTRGSWQTVEKGPAGEEIGNRRLTIDTERTYDLTVARWADTETVRTLTGDVTEHTVPGLLDGRRVWVYLPPGYHESSRSYPVLYMLDGQNVFDTSTSFAGEWRVDEICEELVAAGEMQPIVVVALDNGGAERVYEYTPTTDPRRGIGGGASEHFEAITGTLMPWVENEFRVLTGPRNTAFSGSSLGGLMSLLAALDQADRFGRIGAVSPSLWWDERLILRRFDESPKPDVVLWADMGTEEGSNIQGSQVYVDDLQDLRTVLVDKGFVEGDDLVVFVDQGAQHNEASWSQRFGQVLRFLFPPVETGVGTGSTSVGRFEGQY